MINISSKYFENQDTFLKYIITSSSKYLILSASSTTIELQKFNEQNINIYGAIFSYITFKNKILITPNKINMEISVENINY